MGSRSVRARTIWMASSFESGASNPGLPIKSCVVCSIGLVAELKVTNNAKPLSTVSRPNTEKVIEIVSGFVIEWSNHRQEVLTALIRLAQRKKHRWD